MRSTASEIHVSLCSFSSRKGISKVYLNWLNAGNLNFFDVVHGGLRFGYEVDDSI